MTNLLTSIQNNNANLAVNTPPTFTMPSNSSAQGIPPEAKSTLLAGSMCGVLGGIWAAPPKFDAKNLIEMKDDKFESTTKDIKKKLPQEYENFCNMRIAIKEKINNSLNFFFDNNEKISKTTLLKKLNEPDISTLKKSISELETKLAPLEKIDFETFFNNINSTNTLTEEQKTLLKSNLGEKLYNEILNQKPENIKEYIQNECKILERKKLGFEISKIDINGEIYKKTAQIRTNNLFFKNLNTQINEYYEAIKSKIPKQRLKTAAKWFAMGLGISILLDSIFIMVRSRKQTK